MKAFLARLGGAAAAAIPVYVHTQDWKAAALTALSFVIYAGAHTATSAATTP